MKEAARAGLSHRSMRPSSVGWEGHEKIWAGSCVAPLQLGQSGSRGQWGIRGGGSVGGSGRGGSRRGSGGGGGGRRRVWRRGRLPPSVVVTRGWLVEVWARPWSQPLQRLQPLRGCGGQGGAPGVRGDLGGMKNFHLQTPKQNQFPYSVPISPLYILVYQFNGGSFILW